MFLFYGIELMESLTVEPVTKDDNCQNLRNIFTKKILRSIEKFQDY